MKNELKLDKNAEQKFVESWQPLIIKIELRSLARVLGELMNCHFRKLK